MNTFQTTMEQVGMFVDAAGVAVIVLGIIGATGRALLSAPPPGLDRYMAYRQNLGRAILLGLELLVAGDIIKTVAVSPTLQNMAVLGAIVIIREPTPTSLSRFLKEREGQALKKPIAELRQYGVGAQILTDLGVKNIVLLSNTKRSIVGLDGHGITLVGQKPLE